MHFDLQVKQYYMIIKNVELSEVLWDMVLKIGLDMPSPVVGVVALFIVFFFWASKQHIYHMINLATC